MATLALAAFMYALYGSDMGLESARTLIFTILVWTQVFQAGIWRSDVKTQMELGLFTNPQLIAAILVSVTLQCIILIFEPLHSVFAVADLNPQEWFAALVIAWLPVPLLEWLKTRSRGDGSFRAEA